MTTNFTEVLRDTPHLILRLQQSFFLHERLSVNHCCSCPSLTISKLNLSFIFFSDFVDLPEIDMIFAISAKAQLDGDENYKQMKKITNAMIDKYGTGDILYAVIVYGEEPALEVSFKTSFPSDEALTDIVSAMRSASGASLTKALQLAREVK